MTITDLQLVPVRRDVKGMTALLTDLSHGETLMVTFKRDDFGLFTLEGQAVMSAAVKTFMVGSLFIESGLKPEKAVQAIEPRAASDAIAAIEIAKEVQQDVAGLKHGDLVVATFEQAPHGRFTVTGVVVETANREILAVGTWLLSYKGEAACRLWSLTVIAQVGTHVLPVPARVTTWESDEPVS